MMQTTETNGRLTIPLVCAVTMLFAVTSQAADPIDYPRPSFDLHGPAGAVNSLRFAESPTRLYVAGEDKVVDVYFVGGKETEPPMATRASTLRWERGRSRLGEINAMALSESAKCVAVGGWSLRNHGADIALFGTRLDQSTGTLPSESLDASGNLAVTSLRSNGHNARVLSLEYSPSGSRLASVDSYGEIRLWDTSRQLDESISKSVVVRSRPSSPGSNYLGRKLPAILPDDHTLISAAPVDWADENSEWAVFLTNLRSTTLIPQRLTKKTGTGVVSSLARNRNGTIFAASFEPQSSGVADVAERKPVNGSVYVFRSLDGKAGPLPAVNDLNQMRIAFGPESTLVVSGTTTSGKQVMRFFDCQTFLPLGSFTEEAGLGAVRALAFSPGGKFLARDSANEHSVVLYRVASLGGAGQTARVSEPRRVTSDGLTYTSVRFSNDNKYIIALPAIDQASNETKEHYFDLREMKPLVYIRRPKWTTFNDDWGVTRVNQSFEYFVTDPSKHRWVLTMNSVQGELKHHHHFRTEGRDENFLAITTSLGGVYIYRLPKQGDKAILVRYFRGHTGEIAGVSASPDGRLLVSVSSDRMVNVWSLDGIGGDVSTASARLGVTFLDRGDQGLAVADLHSNGIMAARGFTSGSRITRLRYRPDPQNPDDNGNADNGKEMLRAIASSPLEMSLGFTMGNKSQIWMTPGWEPLASLYTTATGDWACVTPSGYYTASDGDGHELLVWQQNRGRTESARLARGTELRTQFHRLRVLQSLIAEGNLKSAMQLNDMTLTESNTKSGNLLTSAFDKDLHLRVTAPSADTNFNEDDDVEIHANAFLPEGHSPDDYIVQAIVNGQPIGNCDLRNVKSGYYTVSWSCRPKSPVNRVRVIMKHRDRDDVYKFDETTFASTVLPKPMRIHSLAVGANNYSGDLKRLSFAAADATGVASVIESLNASSLISGTHVRLIEAAANRNAILKSLKEIGREIQRHDDEQLLVIFLAGHGMQQDGNYYFLTPEVTGVDEIAQKGVSWKEFEALSALPCRKLFLIDTCHSGAAAELAESGRAAQNLSDSQMVVIAATDRDGEAGESLGAKHGALSACLLQGLRGEAGRVGRADGVGKSASKDGVVTLRELADFVALELKDQHPTIAPRNLLSIESISLMQTAQ